MVCCCAAAPPKMLLVRPTPELDDVGIRMARATAVSVHIRSLDAGDSSAEGVQVNSCERIVRQFRRVGVGRWVRVPPGMVEVPLPGEAVQLKLGIDRPRVG